MLIELIHCLLCPSFYLPAFPITLSLSLSLFLSLSLSLSPSLSLSLSLPLSLSCPLFLLLSLSHSFFFFSLFLSLSIARSLSTGAPCSNSLIKSMRCAIFFISCLTLMSLGCGYPLEFILIPTVYLQVVQACFEPEQNYCGVYFKKV